MASCSSDGLTVYWLLQTTYVYIRTHTYTCIYINMYVLIASIVGSFLLGRDLTLGSGLCLGLGQARNWFDIKKTHSTVKKSSFLVGHARHDADADRERTGDGRRTGK